MAREQDTLNRDALNRPTTTANYPPGTSSEQIRQDIARTRSEMDQTVDALGDRLKPRHLLDEVLDYFGTRGGSTREAGQALREGATGMLDRVKDHPMPALLIGAGVAWMLFEGDRPSRSQQTRASRYDYARGGDVGDWRHLPEHSGSVVDARTGRPYDEATYGAEYRGPGGGSSGGGGPGIAARAGEALSSAGSAVSGAASSAGSAIAGAARSVGEAVSGAVGSTREAASGAAGTVGEYAQGARGAAGEYARGAAEYAREARGYAADYGHRASDYGRRGYGMASSGVSTAMEEYPLTSGIAALALGAVAGLLLPATRRENELMGEYADQLKDQAQELGQEVYGRGKAVATTAISAATDAAGQQGVEPGSLKEKVRHVVEDVTQAAASGASRILEDVKQTASEVTQAGTESAKREGLEPSKLKETAQDIAARTKEAAQEEAQRQRDKPL